MQEDKIKESFQRIKHDTDAIKDAINILSDEIALIKRTLEQTQTPTQQTDRQTNPTIPTEVGGLKSKNLSTSTGNNGVPTDRQTNQQTDISIQKFALSKETESTKDGISHIKNVSDMLNSLDGIKKDLRSKFKKLTSQEMFIFATLYQLEDQGLSPDYKLIANKTSLSESSIRDYILKITNKGIPVDKIKQNNKRVVLSVPQNLRRIASLDTILALREL